MSKKKMTEQEELSALIKKLDEFKEKMGAEFEEVKEASKREMREHPDDVFITGKDIEALIISASGGNSKAEKAIKLLQQEKAGQELIKAVAETLIAIDEAPDVIKDGSPVGKVTANDIEQALNKFRAFEQKPIYSITTRKPGSFLSPVDKVSNKAFEGMLNSNTPLALAMEKKGSKKPITTMVSINFDDMQGVTIRGRKELTPYDREVHDAIVTLFVEGGNDIITLQMIYRTITGDPNARLTAKQAEAISNSITKLMYSNITIDATDELKAYYGVDDFKYNGYLLTIERVIATVNNNVLDAIHILRLPILYEYANYKNQIGRVDIKLLNTPVNKSEEVITLQNYLMRRVLSIKGSSKLSPTIVYDTVYERLEVDAPTQGALRKKKAGVRKNIKSILDYWKKEGFIIAYTENKRGQEVYSVTIQTKREKEA